MAAINFGSAVTLAEAAQLVINCEDTVFGFMGEPGIGKSSMMGEFEKHFGPNYSYAYIDCSTVDLGDIAMPAVNHESKITEYYPNERFKLHEGKPVIIMLDEFGKAAQPVQNMLHPLLESRRPRLGNVPLPEGSRVFITSNLASDGVGDQLKAHTLNRISRVVVRKSSSDEWLAWAVNNGVDGVVMAWVNQFPHCMSSYTEGGQESNPYIYNPKKMQNAYVSPRSLERASRILRNRDKCASGAIIAALCGTLGESAARDMMAYVDYQDQLPSWDSIIKEPTKAHVPEAPGACAVMIFGAITKVTRENIEPFMNYLERFEPEWQAAFCMNLSKNPEKQSVGFTSKAFHSWIHRNNDIL